MAEHKLSYTASEIDRKLGKVDNLVSSVNGVTPDENGNVNISIGSNIIVDAALSETSENPVQNKVIYQELREAGESIGQSLAELYTDKANKSEIPQVIIDVTALPTEDIQENSLYRTMTGSFIVNGAVDSVFTCYCVENLPEAGEPALDEAITRIIIYYNITDGEIYSYIDDFAAEALEISVGWIPAANIIALLELEYDGVIYDKSLDPNDGKCRLLLETLLYTYKNNTWTLLNEKGNTIGNKGTAAYSEIFNSPNNVASGVYSHAEGYETEALGQFSHAEGSNTTASDDNSHAEGSYTTASGSSAHAEGSDTTASGGSAHAEGSNTTASGDYSHAEGGVTKASGLYSHAEGQLTIASENCSHAEGYHTEASGDRSHAEGNSTTASGGSAHAEGSNTTASGIHSHAEGRETTALKPGSHAEGRNTTASGDDSHAEGINTEAFGQYSHAEGYNTRASGNSSHAEGGVTTASGDYSHAEGDNTTASGSHSHAEGSNTTAYSSNSHAEGSYTKTNGENSHAEGYNTIASGENQHVQGKNNIEDVDAKGNPLNTYAHIVGNGEHIHSRSNAHTLDWSGNAEFQGDVKANACGGENPISLVGLSNEVNQLSSQIDYYSNYVTPQMFGAKGDGVTDDTTAVQTALNTGGIVYFPSGRYKVTSQLEALKPCKIIMQGFYPSSYDGGDYPISSYGTKYGARIETHITNGIGLLLGDCVEVDGLAIRAMSQTGFSGVILKYDGSKGIRTYPSQVRLQHIRVDVLNANVGAIESFFDFNPYRTYGVIVDDVVIGSNHIAQFGYYGFRSVLTDWATSIRLSNIIVDTRTHYPFYLDASGATTTIASNWVIQNLAIQTYSKTWLTGVIEKHKTGAYFKGLKGLTLIGCKMWDVNSSYFTEGVVKYVETGISSKITAIGNDSYFNALDTEGNKLNIVSLTSKVTSNPTTGGNIITLSDGTHEHNIEIPAVSLTDEQVGGAVGNWMVENAAPTKQIGKNKLNPEEAENGGLNSSGLENSGDTATLWRLPPIEVKKGDIVRFFYNTGTAVGLRNVYRHYEYDENMNFIKKNSTVSSSYEITDEKTKYYRGIIQKGGNYGIAYENANMCMVTVNDADTGWEDYKVELVGGIGEYLVLTSPNGTKYTLTVSDSGVVSATPVQ